MEMSPYPGLPYLSESTQNRTACDFHYRMDPEMGSIYRIPEFSTAWLIPYRSGP